MAAPRERRRRDDRGGIGKGEQRFDVGLAAAGQQDRQLVDHFLARALDPRRQPPARGMKPEEAHRDLLDDQPGPVAPFYVQQLVADDGPLNLGRLAAQDIREKDERPAQAEGDGLLEFGSVPDVSMRAECGLEIGVRWLLANFESRHVAVVLA